MPELVASRVFIDTGDTFRIRNDWTPDFPGKTRTGKDLVIPPLTPGGKGWNILPGKTALVPWRVIQIWWGDPRSRYGGRWEKFHDSYEKGYIAPREEVIRQLGVLYGSYAADVDALLATEWPRGHDEYGQETKVVPHPVSIQTEDGTPIVPACFDRGGEHIFGFVNTDSEDLNDEVAYRNHLERQITELNARLDAFTAAKHDVPVDEGAKTTAKR